MRTWLKYGLGFGLIFLGVIFIMSLAAYPILPKAQDLYLVNYGNSGSKIIYPFAIGFHLSMLALQDFFGVNNLLFITRADQRLGRIVLPTEFGFFLIYFLVYLSYFLIGFCIGLLVYFIMGRFRREKSGKKRKKK